ncbi:uncharacterized protein LOC122077918 [Macadamia integrifolia]|uniref:uncharacterized protein LOC122077918 n=1 Tax=Macadamia integrifolia TaxID=60698 RepID=UPI001C4FD540|nr:uncharacterized protein LOC122077918 [Macadamia integrifolia]
MAEISGAVRRPHQPRNQTLESLFAAFDPKAFLLSTNSTSSSSSTSTSFRSSNSETMADTTAADLKQNNQQSHTLESLSAALDPKAFLLSKSSTSSSSAESISAQPPTTHQSNHTVESLFSALDPSNWILSQNSTSTLPKPLEFTLADFAMERGPRYKAYAELRESKLRMHNMMIKQHYSDEPKSMVTPPKKRVTFQETIAGGVRNRTSAVAQSVPDFSAVLRKENRRPPSSIALPSMLEMTPRPSKTSKLSAFSSKQGGSKSANAGEKRGGGVMMRKSYASFDELKGLSSAAASAINGENRGGKGNKGINRAVLGYRQF